MNSLCRLLTVLRTKLVAQIFCLMNDVEEDEQETNLYCLGRISNDTF
jgi:hypothetical protein